MRKRKKYWVEEKTERFTCRWAVCSKYPWNYKALFDCKSDAQKFAVLKNKEAERGRR